MAGPASPRVLTLTETSQATPAPWSPSLQHVPPPALATSWHCPPGGPVSSVSLPARRASPTRSGPWPDSQPAPCRAPGPVQRPTGARGDSESLSAELLGHLSERPPRAGSAFPPRPSKGNRRPPLSVPMPPTHRLVSASHSSWHFCGRVALLPFLRAGRPVPGWRPAEEGAVSRPWLHCCPRRSSPQPVHQGPGVPCPSCLGPPSPFHPALATEPGPRGCYIVQQNQRTFIAMCWGLSIAFFLQRGDTSSPQQSGPGHVFGAAWPGSSPSLAILLLRTVALQYVCRFFDVLSTGRSLVPSVDSEWLVLGWMWWR